MILQGDCAEVTKGMESESIDLIVTSPPYDGLRTYKGHSFDFEAIAPQMFRLLKPGGVLVWIVGDQTANGTESGTSFKQALHFKEACGFNLHDTMIYQKSCIAFPETNRYYPIFEYMFVLSKGSPKTAKLLKDRKNIYAGTKNRGTQREPDGTTTKHKNATLGKEFEDYGVRFNIWRYEVGFMKSSNDPRQFEHPATFPEKLAEDHILTWSNPGETVMDPFCGSGTTGVMAIKNGRQFVGIEINEEYRKLAEARISDAEANPPLFLFENEQMILPESS